MYSMDEEDRNTNIYVLYRMAQYLERTKDLSTAETLYLEASKQAEKYLPPNSELRGKVLIGCMEFYDRQGREEDSEKMVERLRSVAVILWDKISQERSLSD